MRFRGVPEEAQDTGADPEVEGHGFRFKASEAPAPGETGESETEGHIIVRWRASEAPAPGEDETEVEGHYKIGR